MVILFSKCSSTRLDCSNNRHYAILDSLQAIKNNEDLNHVFYNPDFKNKFIEEMCRNIGQFHAMTYCEIQPRFSQQRSGIIFLHDKDKFFSFYQRKYGSELKFSTGKDGNDALYNVILSLKSDFNTRAESLKKLYANRTIYDVPFLRITHLNDSSGKIACSSFIIPYVPEDFK